MALSLSAAGCQLQEIVVADVDDVVVAEVYVQVGGAGFGADRILAFLHRTIGGAGPGYQPVPGAVITVTQEDGRVLTVPELPADSLDPCTESLPVGGTGSCYRLLPADVAPGDRLALRIDLADGRVLTSALAVPGDFAIDGHPDGGSCVLPADTPIGLRWSRSAGAGAYINETLVRGLTDALAPRGIPAPDPLYLLGLSVSAADTAIVFPGEFGLFNRFELDRDLALALQEGLPPTTRATVTVAAVEQNYVNWVRGGNFNPSGQVRIPSVVGDGTGVFGAAVVREIGLVVNPDPAGSDYTYPSCVP